MRNKKFPKSAPLLGEERIVAEAMRIADRHGLTAVSMRRIAGKLKAGTMSLYRHVPGKDELLDLLLERAYGEIEVPAMPSGDWKNDLGQLARLTRRVLKRHWWLGPLLTARPPLGENYLRWFEFQLATTSTAGFDLSMRTRIIGTVFAYVTGFVGYELGDEATRRRHRLTPERMRKFVRPRLAPLLATGRFPNLALFVEQCTAQVTDEDFEFGLEAVIDGAASRSATENGKRVGR
jgi:AcrR family transcriptional regulator